MEVDFLCDCGFCLMVIIYFFGLFLLFIREYWCIVFDGVLIVICVFGLNFGRDLLLIGVKVNFVIVGVRLCCFLMCILICFMGFFCLFVFEI